MTTQLAEGLLEWHISRMGSGKNAQSFDLYCAVEGVQPDTLLNFDEWNIVFQRLLFKYVCNDGQADAAHLQSIYFFGLASGCRQVS